MQKKQRVVERKEMEGRRRMCREKMRREKGGNIEKRRMSKPGNSGERDEKIN